MTIRCNSKDELKKIVRDWNGEQLYLYYMPSGSGWKFKTTISLGERYSYYAYVDRTLCNADPYFHPELKRGEYSKKFFSKRIDEVISDVLSLL